MEINTNTKKGQIIRGSKLGEIIYDLAKDPENKTFLDSGTFNGLGTTKCIYDGIKDSKKTDFKVYSFECNFSRHLEAIQNLNPLMKGFNLIHGTIISPDEIEYHKDIEEVKISIMINWLNEDLELMKKCKCYSDKVKSIFWDVAILDGSEFTGDEEFNLIKNNIKYLILDDTKAYKHSRNRQFILNNLDLFELIEDNITDRNGYLVCKNKNY